MTAPLTTFYHEGHYEDYTPVAAVAAGAVIELADNVVTGRIGVATLDIAANTLGALRTDGCFRFPLNSGDLATQGTPAYWDAGNNEMTDTAGANNYAGRFEGKLGTLLCSVNINKR